MADTIKPTFIENLYQFCHYFEGLVITPPKCIYMQIELRGLIRLNPKNPSREIVRVFLLVFELSS